MRHAARWGSVGGVLALTGLCGTAAWTLHLNGPATAGGRRVMTWYAICWVIFAIAAACARLVPRRAAVALILLGGLALQLLAMNWRPTTTDDWYRYIWDGTVQAHGIDPYRYAPTDPALEPLRDPWIFPGAAGVPGPARGHPEYCGFTQPGQGCVRINRPDVHTIYPPVAEAAFLGLHAVSPQQHRLRAAQALAAALAVLATVVLLWVLRAHGRDPRWAAWWAWCPTVWLECGNNAHIDVLGVVFLLGTLGLVARAAPTTRRIAAAGVLFGAAVAVKLIPALVGPALLARRAVLLLGAAAALVAVGYLPHVIAVGTHVFGYLPGYLHEEGYSGEKRFGVLRLLVGDSAAPVLAVLVIAAVAGWAWWMTRTRPAVDGAVLIAGVTFAVIEPSEPWYGLLLIALAAAACRPEWLLVAAAAYPVYSRDFLGVGDTAMQQRCYLPAALLVAVVALVRFRRPAHEGGAPDPISARRPAPPRPR
ncbi:MAG TPA: glycosyltransferase 87 family protein [Sporichthyaceae bacterium]|jgi:hypothetical protein